MQEYFKNDIMKTITETASRSGDRTFLVSESGHLGGTNKHRENDESYHALNKRISKKIRLNILRGKWPADTLDERMMLRKFYESKLTPEEFIETWK